MLHKPTEELTESSNGRHRETTLRAEAQKVLNKLKIRSSEFDYQSKNIKLESSLNLIFRPT
ncbi:hypothetical protein OUZ56_007210 [Daphnia magna]|uniref:Uncharacterized protein n=1 Tax=Daphnia magna TaxID=35525 RepID=A0ABQ9YXW7_9CRUS|nr:hypothetical protein OUZ56_007210 [Daphnia magna]